jgi:uncharacterized membrane protein
MANFNINNFVKIFVLFILIDIIWLKFFAGPKYTKMILNIQGEPMKAKMGPAGLVYVFMTILLMLFGSQSNTRNFLLGSLTYGIYDFTNLAIFNKFDKLFALYDTLWGGVLFAIVGRVYREIKF